MNVTLDPEHDAKLTQLAERTHLEKGTLARSLLLQAIDEREVGAVCAERKCVLESSGARKPPD